MNLLPSIEKPTIREMVEQFIRNHRTSMPHIAYVGISDVEPFAEAVAARELERCAPYMRHKPDCYVATDDNGEYVNCYKPIGGCDCGLSAIREMADQERAR